MKKHCGWLTEDGKFFEDEAEALAYEKKLRLIAVINKLEINTEYDTAEDMAKVFLTHREELIEVLK